MSFKRLAALAALACVGSAPAWAKGYVQCAVNTGLAGFSFADSQGKWTGLDVDLCKAIAVAMFGDAEKVKFTPTTAQQRFVALQSGEVDVITRNATQTLLRDTQLGFNGAGINFFDGQGFMVTAKSGLKSAKELNGATICVQPGTTTELNLADYFRKEKMTFKPVLIDKLDELLQAFASGRCDSYTTDASGLAGARAGQLSGKGEYVILPERISKEPLGPMVRHGDDQWFDLVRFVLDGMIEAEELGVSQKNVDEMLKSEDPVIKRFLGVTPGYGKAVGVETSDGEVLRAKQFVVSALNPHQTYLDLLDENLVPREIRDRAKAFQYNLLAPLFALNLNLNEPPRYAASGANPQLDKAFMVIMGLDHVDQFSDIVKHHEAGTVPPTVMWGACPTVFDPSQAPPGKHTAFMWEKLPYFLNGDPANWDSAGEAHGKKMLELWKRHAPNLEGAVIDSFPCRTCAKAISWSARSPTVRLATTVRSPARGITALTCRGFIYAALAATRAATSQACPAIILRKLSWLISE